MPSLPLTNETSTEISSGWPTDPTDPLQAISHVFHTSGTSGTPKPIPHTHAASVSSLPRRRIGDPDTLTSSFTTTPLFHGGISDLLRAWMARSMLYLYPSSTTAVTAANVMGAFRACTEYPTNTSYTPPISAFLSVPYILTLLSPTAGPSDKEGATAMLARMEIVSTGGAPLDTAVGDGLVEKGVHLTSRLGSSECGCKQLFTPRHTVSILTQRISLIQRYQFFLHPIGISKTTVNGNGSGMIRLTPLHSNSSCLRVTRLEENQK